MLYIVNTETIEENGIEYKIETYSNGAKVKTPAAQATTEPLEPTPPEPTQLDRIEEQVNAIASGTTTENTEAINALLGV